jgi:hypothetical protein
LLDFILDIGHLTLFKLYLLFVSLESILELLFLEVCLLNLPLDGLSLPLAVAVALLNHLNLLFDGTSCLLFVLNFLLSLGYAFTLQVLVLLLMPLALGFGLCDLT